LARMLVKPSERNMGGQVGKAPPMPAKTKARIMPMLSACFDVLAKAATSMPKETATKATASVMTSNRIRHLPIMDGDRLTGVLSIGDVVNALKQEKEVENRYLRDYIQGAVR